MKTHQLIDQAMHATATTDCDLAANVGLHADWIARLRTDTVWTLLGPHEFDHPLVQPIEETLLLAPDSLRAALQRDLSATTHPSLTAQLLRNRTISIPDEHHQLGFDVLLNLAQQAPELPETAAARRTLLWDHVRTLIRFARSTGCTDASDIWDRVDDTLQRVLATGAFCSTLHALGWWLKMTLRNNHKTDERKRFGGPRMRGVAKAIHLVSEGRFAPEHCAIALLAGAK